MRFVSSKIASTIALCLLWHAPTSFAQDAQPAPTPAPTAATPPAVPPEAAASTATSKPPDYLPVCSTEKVNGDCFLNIDRRYPISMPTFQMRKNAHITVYVFHPFAFESLTLDPGSAQAFEGTDQAAGLVNALIPLAKGAIMGTEVQLAGPRSNDFSLTLSEVDSALEKSPPNDDLALAGQIRSELVQLDTLLTQALAPVTSYISETKDIYNQVREIESAVPRPGSLGGAPLRYPGVNPALTPNPWERYSEWRLFMIKELNQQGGDTAGLLGQLPGPCQTSTPPVGPWLPPARPCKLGTTAGTIQDSVTPLAIPGTYAALHAAMVSDLAKLPQDRPDPATYSKLQVLKNQLEERYQRVVNAITLAPDLLPSLMTKISTDMQSLLTNILMARDPVHDPHPGRRHFRPRLAQPPQGGEENPGSLQGSWPADRLHPECTERSRELPSDAPHRSTETGRRHHHHALCRAQVRSLCRSIPFLASKPVLCQHDGGDDQEWRTHSNGRQNRHDQNRSSARDPLRGGKLPHQPGIRLAWRTQKSHLRYAWRRAQSL
jgi:hypothetical protein